VANTALFYPHLYPSEHSLKLAALCWDSVYTLTPLGTDEPPDAIRKLDETLGGVLREEWFERAAEDPTLQDEFERWVGARADALKATPHVLADATEREVVGIFGSKLGSRDRYKRLHELGVVRSESRSHEKRIPSWTLSEFKGESFERPMPVDPMTKSERRDYEKYTKLNDRASKEHNPTKQAALRRKTSEFYERHLVSVRESEQLVWVAKDVALHYLSLCAAHIANEDKRDLVASDQTFTDAVFNDARAHAARVSTTTVEALLPVAIDDLDPKRIAELREELRLERRSHFADVADFVDEFERISSVGEWERLERDAVEQAQLAATSVRNAARRARVELAGTAVGVSLTPPAVASMIASLLGVGLFVPAGIAVALSLVGAQAYLRYRGGSEEMPDRWSYVVKLGRELA
jgi:hypothetical protein